MDPGWCAAPFSGFLLTEIPEVAAVYGGFVGPAL